MIRRAARAAEEAPPRQMIATLLITAALAGLLLQEAFADGASDILGITRKPEYGLAGARATALPRALTP
jgi:hypothetical protein